MIRKTPAILLLFAVLFLARSKPVHAYIDPATTTYLIQIVSALVITLGVTIGIFFNRIRLFFLNIRVGLGKLWIGFFSKKDRPASPSKPDPRGGREGRIDKRGFLWSDDRSFRKRLTPSLLAGASLSLTFFVFGIFELYAGNLEDFTFPITGLMPLLILTALAAAVLIACLSALLRGRIFDLLLSLLLGLSLASYIQANFLNTDLGRLTGDAVNWDLLAGKMAANLALWLFMVSLPLLIRFLSKKFWRRFALFLPLLLVTTQLISGLFLYAREPGLRRGLSSSYLSRQGIYEVADGDNILVFILDRLDNRFLDLVERNDPGFFDGLDGFTRFTNNVSRYSQTFPSVTETLTGVGYDFKEGYSAYLKRAWKEGTFIPGLREAGFVSKLYLTPSQAYDQARDLSPLAANLADGRVNMDKKAALDNFIRLSAYRSAPLALKPFYWTSTDAFEKMIQATPDPAPYYLDDPLFFSGLADHGLRVTPDDRGFIFLHLNGPHPPFAMNEMAQAVEDGDSSYLKQTKGSFHILFEYLDQLKKTGQYDRATIIITGDHAARSSDLSPPESALVTGLLVKAGGKSGTPLEYSDAPVCSDNLRATVYQAAGLDYSAYGPTYFDLLPGEQLPRFMEHRLFPSQGNPGLLLTYRILGDANDFDNWELVSEEILP